MSIGMVIALIKSFFNTLLKQEVDEKIDEKIQDYKFSPQVNDNGDIVFSSDRD